MSAPGEWRRALPVLLAAAILALMFLPPLLGLPTTVTDDYYYYERIARHLVAGHGSTYDGVVRTNGYHPLWMAFVALAVGLEHLTALAAQLWSLAFCAALSVMTVWLVWRNSARTAAAAAGTLLLASYAVFFGVMAMETSLTLLCAALLLGRLASRDFVPDPIAALLLGLCFLSRIDCLVYFFPLIAWLWWRAPARNRLSFAVPVFMIIAAYCALSIWYFGQPTPISGMAKAVRHIGELHSATWRQLLIGRQNQLMIAGTVVLTLLAARGAAPRARALLGLSVVGIVLFYVITSLHSDWVILEWYLYPFALHLMLAIALLERIPASGPATAFAKILSGSALCIATAALLLVGFRNARHAQRQDALVQAAQRIEQLLVNAPAAVVAMGDRAGAVGQALPSHRLIQMEGLVMDRAFLEAMRHADSILPILRAYRVDYYVATGPRLEPDGCYTTWEPSQSRGASIRLETRICAQVADHFVIDGTPTVVFHAPWR